MADLALAQSQESQLVEAIPEIIQWVGLIKYDSFQFDWIGPWTEYDLRHLECRCAGRANLLHWNPKSTFCSKWAAMGNRNTNSTLFENRDDSINTNSQVQIKCQSHGHFQQRYWPNDLANDQDTVILLKRVLGSAGSQHKCDTNGPNGGEDIVDTVKMKGTGYYCHTSIIST